MHTYMYITPSSCGRVPYPTVLLAEVRDTFQEMRPESADDACDR